MTKVDEFLCAETSAVRGPRQSQGPWCSMGGRRRRRRGRSRMGGERTGWREADRAGL